MKTLWRKTTAGVLSVMLFVGYPAVGIAAQEITENAINGKVVDGKQAAGAGVVVGQSEGSRSQQLLTETWKRQTLEGILDGKICIPDTAINAYLEENFWHKGSVKTISVKSMAGNRLWLDIDTTKLGRVKILASIEEFKHDAQTSHIKIRFLEKRLPKKPVLNLFVNLLGAGIFANMLGKVDLGTGIKTKISGNTAVIDFHEQLYTSDLGQMQFMGLKLLDMLIIKAAKADIGQINVYCDLKGGRSVRLLLP